MASHPLNLALRFMLEVSALVAMGVWGWQRGSGWGQYALAIGVPLAAAFVWGAFAVPNDPSRGGAGLVPVPGMVRIALELALFGFAVWALFELGAAALGWALGVAVAVHYVVSLDRLVWLMRK
jgi:Protein of unknown function (DUF2568)